MDPVILVSVDSTPLDLKYSSSARCTVEICPPADVPPQIADEVRVCSNWVYELRKNLEVFDIVSPYCCK